METHRILGGKVRLYRRVEGGAWHCSTYLQGKERRKTTKQKSLPHAINAAEEWYFDLRGRERSGNLDTGNPDAGKTFAQAAELFIGEYEAATLGHRSPKWVQSHKDRLRLHLLPFFGDRSVSGIKSGAAQEYRVHRMTAPKGGSGKGGAKPWKPPARKTMHNEIVTLSMTLKAAERHGWIDHVPNLSDPYRRHSKVGHRPWFSPSEFGQLCQATHRNALGPKRERYRWHAEQLNDYVLFMGNTGLRPDEAKRLEFRDVVIAKDDWSGGNILEIDVRGKRGVGHCKSMPEAVRPFERLRDRVRPGPAMEPPKPSDKLFPNEFKKMFNGILGDIDLKVDRNGKARTAYSLRHTYICLRLMDGADIYQVAKNCRTSVEMIQKHYAAHLKDVIDTSLVNVRNGNPPAKGEAGKQMDEGPGNRPRA